MNYVREINSFYDWLETNSIPDTAIGLWHALMHINNKAAWVPEFAVAISTLSTKTGLKKDAIIRARLRLEQAGRIAFKSRSGQQSAIYYIIPFESDKATQTTPMDDSVVLTDANRNTNRAQSATQTEHKPLPLLNKTKLNETKQGGSGPREIIDINFAKAIRAIESQFPARLNSKQINVVSSLITDGLDPDIVTRAVEITRLAGKPITYLWGILNSCEEQGIFTLEAFEEDRERFNKAPSNQTGKASYFAQRARELEHEEG